MFAAATSPLYKPHPPPPPLPISPTWHPLLHSLLPLPAQIASLSGLRSGDRAQHGAEEPVRVGPGRRRRRGSRPRVREVGGAGERRWRGRWRRSGRRGVGGGAAEDAAQRWRQRSYLRRVQLLPQVNFGSWGFEEDPIGSCVHCNPIWKVKSDPLFWIRSVVSLFDHWGE